jgi:hypothetical protein
MPLHLEEAATEVMCQPTLVASVDHSEAHLLGEDDDDLEPPAGLAR